MIELEFVPTDELVAELKTRFGVLVICCVKAARDGERTEFHFDQKGAEHEILGAIELLDMKNREKAYRIFEAKAGD